MRQKEQDARSVGSERRLCRANRRGDPFSAVTRDPTAGLSGPTASEVKGGILKKTEFTLSPEKDVELQGGRFIATSSEPWLSIEPRASLERGKLVEIVYRASLWDEPVRPVFRFWTSKGGWRDQIGPGPVAGAAIWTGRIPAETVHISVSPTNRVGRFDFELAAIRRISSGALFAKGLRRRPRSALASILARHIGRSRESGGGLDWAAGATPFAHYAAWRAARNRPIDLERLDAPRCDWTTSPEINLVVDADHADPADLARLITALRAQLYPRWRVALAVHRQVFNLPDEPRILRLPLSEIIAFLRALPAESIVASIAAGDALYPFALAAITEAAARMQATGVFYGDEDYCRFDHRLVPVLKPGWSPVLQTNRPYLGHAVFLRAKILADWPEAELSAYVDRAEIPASAALRLEAARPHSLRRVLLTRAQPWQNRAAAQVEPSETTIRLAGNPSALIIIPTRDRARLLSHSLASIFTKTAFDNFSIIIVDNGSVEPDALRLFEKFRGDRIVSVLHSAGPFNDSLLCNAAAARRKADVLVFLNDDLEILSEDWLGRLVASALLQDVGAVGGLLLGPGRRIQQAEIVLGSRDDTRGFSAGPPEPEGDLLGLSEVEHEVSAIPRACLAVARRKFMLIGGFDAEHLPSAHNDIDLCLRLSEKGWPARIDPAVRLICTERPNATSAAFQAAPGADEQGRWFEARWVGVLRDDPFHHPGLSLHYPDKALG